MGLRQEEIPDMLEAYDKYHDKGFEIVSFYICEDEQNAVATVKQFVEERKLPWVILTESFTGHAGLGLYRKLYGIGSFPKMVLVDKEGKVIALGNDYKEELRKVFRE